MYKIHIILALLAVATKSQGLPPQTLDANLRDLPIPSVHSQNPMAITSNATTSAVNAKTLHSVNMGAHLHRPAMKFRQLIQGAKENHVRFSTHNGIHSSESTVVRRIPAERDSNDESLDMKTILVKTGNISWTSPEGHQIRMSYIADDKGFRLVPNNPSVEIEERSVIDATMTSTPIIIKHFSTDISPANSRGRNAIPETLVSAAVKDFGAGRKYLFATRNHRSPVPYPEGAPSVTASSPPSVASTSTESHATSLPVPILLPGSQTEIGRRSRELVQRSAP